MSICVSLQDDVLLIAGLARGGVCSIFLRGFRHLYFITRLAHDPTPADIYHRALDLPSTLVECHDSLIRSVPFKGSNGMKTEQFP